MKVAKWILILTTAVVISGCKSYPYDLAAFKMPGKVEVTAKNYLIQPPDAIQIISPTIPELNQQQQTVRPDGKISFPNIGEFDVAGKTPLAVADTIREKVSKLYALAGDYPVDVRIAVFNSAVYYVLGEVQRPGPKPYTGRDTVLRAIADAYPTVLAWKSRILIIRPSADPLYTAPKIFELKWKQIAAQGDTSMNVLLQEGDVIYVPPTILASVAMKIEEFVRPIGRAFSTAYIVDGQGYR